MRRLGLATLIAAVACGTAYAAPLAGPSAKKASVKLERCSLEDHSALFYARMRRVPGSVRMKLKFALLERARSAVWRKVDSQELDQWRKSEVGVRRFGYHQEVKGLTEGLAYRVSVRYRWYDGAGDVIKRAKRRSRVCRQYSDLANLKIQAIGRQRLASVWRYDFRVRNTGEAAATGVPVQLMVDGAVIDSSVIANLAPGEGRVVRLRGPGCQAQYVGIVDPEAAIAESDESDNRAIAPC